MVDQSKVNAQARMQKCIESFRTELSKLRTGRAHPGLLEHVMVEYYGSDTPLSQVASVTIEDARTLSVRPWEKDMVSKIEKAILKSDLGLNPSSAGMVIRVPLPPLTEERRRDLARVVRDEAEKARVAIRNIRREAMQHCKDLLKAKSISEDEERRAETEIQKLTDTHIGQVDDISSQKEKDLMSV